MNLNNIKKFLISVSVILVIVLGWVYFQKTKVYEFLGNVEKIENGTVFISGFFFKDGKEVGEKENNLVSIQVKTDNNTKITRLALHIPNGVESFNVKDLKQEESLVSLEVLEKDSRGFHTIGVESLLNKSLSGDTFTAKSLYFRVPIFDN